MPDKKTKNFFFTHRQGAGMNGLFFFLSSLLLQNNLVFVNQVSGFLLLDGGKRKKINRK